MIPYLYENEKPLYLSQAGFSLYLSEDGVS